MGGLLIIELIALFVFIFISYHVIKYRNPYKLFMVFGKKGSGKTTLMNKLAVKYRKKGWSVYSDSKLPGCYCFPIEQFGNIMFPENSLILIDEVGLIWDNRHYKTFPEHVKKYFKYQRQYKNTVYLFSQSFDVDKKIRDLTDHLYIVQNVLNCFSVARRITKTVTIVHADKSAQGESKIVDDYKIDPWIFALSGSVEITYIPKWVKYFRSFDPPKLLDYEFEVIPDVPAKPSALARAWRARLEERKLLLDRLNHDPCPLSDEWFDSLPEFDFDDFYVSDLDSLFGFLASDGDYPYCEAWYVL